MIDIFVILSSYTVGVWLTNAHNPSFQTQKKTRGYIVHIVHKWIGACSWPHGRWPGQRATGLCGHSPHAPPPKYYIVRFCKVGGRWPVANCCLPDGPRVGPAAEGHGSGGATNKIFYGPHCPHRSFLKIFVIFGTCLKAYLLHRARSKRLRRA